MTLVQNWADSPIFNKNLVEYSSIVNIGDQLSEFGLKRTQVASVLNY